jgi:hypothetical protein
LIDHGIELIMYRCILDALGEDSITGQRDRRDLLGLIREVPQIELRNDMMPLRLLVHDL